MDFLFIQELGNKSTLHIGNYSTDFSVASILRSKETDSAARCFEINCCNIHGALKIISGDPEFNKRPFIDAVSYLGIEFAPRTARRHIKLGVVERKNAVIRLLVKRLLNDGDYFRGSRKVNFDNIEVISRAVFWSKLSC